MTKRTAMDCLVAESPATTDFNRQMEQEAHQALLHPLPHVASSRVLVVGGGVAGQQAALDAAALGLPVTLVEAGPSIGGLMAQLDKTFPTNDCAMCILSPRMLEISRQPQIEILTLTRMAQLQGEAGNFRALLQARPRYVDETKCTGCGECVRVCPARLPDPHNLGLSQTKAIHVPFPQAIPQAAVISPSACRLLRGKKCEACVQVCPAGAIDIKQTPQNRILTAGAVIMAAGAQAARKLDFPGAGQEDVVTSLQFERLLSAGGPHQGKLLRPSDHTEPGRIAFIQCAGSRDLRQGAAYCSSLCCLASLKQALVAQELTSQRTETAIFYMDLRAQGKGHEAYLTQAEEKGVELIRSRVTGLKPLPEGGVLVRYTNPAGRPAAAPFDLAVLAVGLRPPADLAYSSRVLGIPLNAHGFIRAGSGNPVITARPGVLTCGAAQEPMDITQSVTSAGAAAQAAAQLLSISPRTFPPQRPLPEADPAAPKIGIFLCHCGTNIAKTIDLPKLATEIRKLPGVAHVEDDMFTCAVESTQRMADTIRTLGLNRVVVAACTPRTHEPLFREVVAAAGLNPGYFTMANIREQCAWVHQGDPAAAQTKALQLVTMAVLRSRVLPPLTAKTLPVLPRALVLGGGVAGMSAAVCLADQGFHTYLIERSSGLGGVARRLYFTLEGLHPPTFVQELGARVYRHPNIEVLTSTELLSCEGSVGNFRSRIRRERGVRPEKERVLEHGVVLVATGGREFHPQGRYLYGQDPRVLTQLELEDLISGQASRLEKARRLVMIQCVGSREPEHPYCSRLCCSEAIKNSLLLKKRYPLLDITILYRDIRAYGFREDYYREAKEMGVKFLPFQPDRFPQVTAAKRRPLAVRVWDGLLQGEVALAADLVILSAGIEPSADHAHLSKQLGIPLTLEGFFLEAHQKLRPVETPMDGIFLCGLAHYPKSLGETVAQAQAAAGRAAAILFQKELASGEITAQVDSHRCRRCLTCVEICPYGAVKVRPGIPPMVQEELCRGCGTCVAECPAGAMTLSRYTDEEVEAEISAALS